MGYIKLHGIELFGHHGYYDEEQQTGGKFTVNIKFQTSLDKAGHTDTLSDTVNYENIYKLIREEFKTPSRLLEHVGERIMRRIKSEYPQIGEVELEIFKHHPPMGGEIKGVSIVLTQ